MVDIEQSGNDCLRALLLLCALKIQNTSFHLQLIYILLILKDQELAPYHWIGC